MHEVIASQSGVGGCREAAEKQKEAREEKEVRNWDA